MQPFDEVPDIEFAPFDDVDVPEHSGLKHAVKQLAGGVLDVGAFVPGLYGLLNKGTKHLGFELPGGQAASDLSEKMQHGTNELLGTVPAQNTRDAVLRAIGNQIIPIPGNWIKGLVGVKQAMQAAPKTTKVVGNVAELLTPTTVNPSATRYLAGVGVGTAIQEGANAITNDPSYTSQLPDMGQDRPQPVDMLPFDDVPDATNMQPFDELQLPGESNGFWTPTKIGLSLAGAGAATVVALAALRRPRMLRTDTVAAPAEDALKYGTATTPKERFVGENVDLTQPIASQIERTADKAAREEWQRTADLYSQAGGDAQIKAYLNSGMLPGKTTRGVALREVELELEKMPKEFTDKLSKGMLAQDIIESRAAIRKAENNSTLRTDLPGWSDADAFKYAQALQADPHANLVAMRIRQAMNDALGWVAEKGRLSPGLVAKLRINRPMYMTMRRAGEEMTDEMFDALHKRTHIEGQGASEVLNVVQAAESYISELMKRTMDNMVRREAIDKLAYGKDKRVTMSVKPVKKPGPGVTTIYRNGVAEHWQNMDPLMHIALKLQPRMADNILSQTRSVKQLATTGLMPWSAIRALFWDPLLAANYRQEGRQYGRLIDGTLQAISGGRLARKGDYLGATISSMEGVVRTAGAKIAGEVSSSIEASLRAHSGVWQQLDNALSSVGMPGLVRKVADAGRDAYLNSVYHAFERGGTNSTMLYNDLTQASHILEGMTDSFKNTRLGQVFGSTLGPVWRLYRGTIDTLQNATKVQYIAENKGRAPMETLVAEARSISGGDMTKRGLGHVPNAKTTMEDVEGPIAKSTNFLAGLANKARMGDVTKAGSNYVPWWNPTVNGAVKFINVADRDRGKLVAGVGASVGMAAISAAILNSIISPEHSEDYWSQPSWQRISTIQLPIGDEPGNRLMLPVPPEFVPINAMMQQMTAALFDLMPGGGAPSLLYDTAQSLEAVGGVPMPPLLAATLNMLGLGENLRPLHESPVRPGYSDVSSLLPVNVQEMFASMFGTVGRLITETGDAINGEDMGGGVEAGAAALAQEFRTRTPLVGQLWGGPLEYSSNETSKRLAVKLQALDNITNQMRASLTNGRITQLEFTTNNEFNAKAMELQAFFLKNPMVVDLKQDIKSLQNEIANNDRMVKTQERLKELSQQKRMLRGMRERMSLLISAAETDLGVALEDLDPSR